MITVSDVMTRRVVTASPETTFKDAVGLLQHNRVSGLPVVDRPGSSSASFLRLTSSTRRKSANRMLTFSSPGAIALTVRGQLRSTWLLP